MGTLLHNCIASWGIPIDHSYDILWRKLLKNINMPFGSRTGNWRMGSYLKRVD